MRNTVKSNLKKTHTHTLKNLKCGSVSIKQITIIGMNDNNN